MPWIWEALRWPSFTWASDQLLGPLAHTRHVQGVLLGHMRALGFSEREEASLHTLIADVLQTSAIEGERLDMDQVRSSLAIRLGMDVGLIPAAARSVDGIVEMTVDATTHARQALTRERLCAWHAALFPGGRSGMRRIRVGRWRDDRSGPMQVVSGRMGRERVHFEAPPAARLDAEVDAFLAWFESASLDPVLHAALAHLWFVTLHPFEDGNGRIARAIADLALTRADARDDDTPSQRFYSMSAQIQAERAAYYTQLEQVQRGSLDVTDWLLWFLACLQRAVAGAERELRMVLTRARFWARHAHVQLGERQRKVLELLLDGRVDTVSSSKWAKLTKCSQDTAARDIAGLVSAGILRLGPGRGRSTHYVLVEHA